MYSKSPHSLKILYTQCGFMCASGIYAAPRAAARRAASLGHASNGTDPPVSVAIFWAALAGLLLGLAENLCLAFIDPQWSEAVTFAILFFFILLRPGGVFGRVTVS